MFSTSCFSKCFRSNVGRQCDCCLLLKHKLLTVYHIPGMASKFLRARRSAGEVAGKAARACLHHHSFQGVLQTEGECHEQCTLLAARTSRERDMHQRPRPPPTQLQQNMNADCYPPKKLMISRQISTNLVYGVYISWRGSSVVQP